MLSAALARLRRATTALRARPLRAAFVVALVALAALVAWRMALAASITVTTTADTVDGNTTSIAALQASPGADGLISLREAITAAINTAAGPHTVVLPAGTFNLASTLNITAAVTLQGAGAGTTIVSGQNARQVFNVTSGLTMSGLSVSNGSANVGGCIGASGGSINATNVTLNNCVALFGAGGGIYATSTAISFTSVTLQSATANNDGGGVYLQDGSLTVATSTFSSNTSNNGSGGAVYLAGAANATFTDTTFGSNHANNNGAGVAMSSSGSLALTRATFSANGTNNGSGGLQVSSGSATLTNVTFSGNSGANGGALATGGGSTTLTNVTVASNSATTNYGVGGLYRSAGTLALVNTIVANNTNTSGASNCSGTITNSSNNLDSGTSCGFGSTNGSLSSSNPLLSSLASNGGSTQTMALGAGSPAINAGTALGAPAADQRGTARSGATDIGAYEYAAAATYAISGAVFEDVNYGGGAGRSLASSSGVGVNGATVELYSSGGVYVSNTTTAGGGAYSFTGLAAATYYVRVVNSTVPSQRSGTTGTLRGVMTYRTNASSGTAVAVTDYVGGTNPALIDPGAGSSGATFNTGTSVFSAVLSGTAQSVAPVTLGSANITGVDFGFNFDTVVNTNDSGQGSLRQAITNANTLGGDASLAQSGRTAAIESIVFMISNGSTAGGGSLSLSGGLRSGFNYFATSAGSYNVATIAVLSALPTVSAALVIDAQAQPGWTLNPIIELNGSSAGSTSGLNFSAGSNVVRGLVVNRFTGSGIALNAAGNTLTGNWLGLNAAGTAASANTSRGIYVVTGGSNTIGGTSAAARNVLSGNGNHGLYVAAGNNNLIRGNYLGTNAAGTAAVPNGGAGLYLHSLTSGNTVGGSAAGQGNVISGNTQEGVVLRGGSGGNVLRGNTIGMNAAGSAALPNSAGIALSATGNNNAIGGTGTGDGNLIAGNVGAGIAIFGSPASHGDAILGNSIHSNGGLGIDLGTSAITSGDGITANTGATTSGQPNLLMNYPVFTSASLSGSTLTVAGYVGSAANQSAFASARVEVFISDAASLNGSGRTYLGYLTSDANGNFSGSIGGVAGVTAGSSQLTATATATSNDTSEFGPNFTVASIAGTVFEDVNYGGGAGRSLATSGGVGLAGVTVELYDASGTYVSSTTTAAGGGYAFVGLGSATYYVRVVGSTVASQRSGSTASLRGVMTYRTNASSGSAVAVTDYVGGTNPALVDPGAGSPGASFNITTGVFGAVLSGTAQSYSAVAASASGVSGVDFGFNFDTVVNVNDAGQGSLRQAITNANTLTGDASLAQSGRTAAIENLVFMISNGTTGSGGSLSLTGGLRTTNNYFSGGIATIAPASVLPEVTGMVLDAQAQPGWSAAPIIELNGSGAGANVSGLTARGGTTLRGFIVNRFTGNGVNFYDAGSNVLQGSYIGLNSAGTAASANGGSGVNTYNSPNNTIGGTGTNAGNVISGNSGIGINLQGTGAGVVIQGNIVGLNAAGTARVANGSLGVLVGVGSVTIGGTSTAARNVIAGNTYENVQLGSGASGGTVQGNYIGTTGGGATGIANGGHGLWINGSSNVQVGGTAAGAGNVFAGNAGRGVTISGNVSGNAVLGNSIFGNGGIGIDLGNDGLSANDGAKTSGQPNLLMDYPVFTSASLSGTTLTVAGYVGSAAGQSGFASARVEVFISDTTNTNGQGRTYLGYVTADANGNFSGSIANVSGVTAGSSMLTGTATDGSNNTSEFGPNAMAVSLTLSGTVFEDLNYGGGAGRSLAASNGAGIAGATVELYRASGSLAATTTTAGNGTYSFAGLTSDSYVVRVVTSTVTSTRSGSVAGLWPVQTWRYEASRLTPAAVTDEVGGARPDVADSAAAPGLSWTQCATESGGSANPCAFSGTRLVRFGTGSSWTTRVATGGVTCSAAVFGDPAVGSAKTCEVLQPHLHSASSAYVSAGSGVAGIDFGFNFDTVVNTNDTGQGSLRQAITNANTLGGDASLAQNGRSAGIENLVFMIGNGSSAAGLRSALNFFTTSAGSYNVATIAPASLLPALTSALVMDAQTQPGWSLAPLIELNGSGAGNTTTSHGLQLLASNCVVRGFVINRFAGEGVYSNSGSNLTIQGNRIGTDAAGTAARANARSGIYLSGGNTSGHLIGGSTAAQRNVISGNTREGISLGGASNSAVQGNYIGVNASASGLLGNGRYGVSIAGSVSGNAIGGTAAGAGNVIAGNTLQGVMVSTGSTGNAVLGNAIYGNGGLGIDLNNDGVTANDGAKTAGQANLNMDMPVFSSAVLSSGTLTVAGYVGSAAGQSTFANARVEVFVSDNDALGYGEAQTYLGYVTTDASGNFNGPITVPVGVTITAGSTRLTATATDTSNNTSEFGPNYLYGMSLSGTVFEDVHYGGGAGRSLAASGGSTVNGATVELYNASGVFISSTTTAGAGSYSFTSLAAGNYLVRVVSSSVASTRSGSSASLRGVLTYRTTATTGTAVAVTDFVGGTNPSLVDPGAGSAGASFNPATGVYSAVLSGTAHAYASVNASTGGVAGLDFGFNFDTVVNTNDSGQGSLRQAITNANTLSGDASLAQTGRTAAIENLVFMIPNGSAAAGLRSANNLFSGGVATIAPTSALPTISAPLVLDAQTQPGWSSNPIVELNGSGAGSVSGLTLAAAGSVVRGWVINRFTLDGLRGSSVGSLVIQGNYIGTTASGNTAAPNLQRGMYLAGGSNQVVGGTQPAQRNVISGNSGRGITIAGGSGHVVQGNRIGVGADGSTVLPNGGFGLLMQSGASNSTVGGTSAAAANVIRGNTRGVQIDVGVSGIAVLGNAIYGNAGLGINLGTPGPNLNDGAKAAGQANLMMDSPVVTSARARGNQLTVAGYVGTAAGQSAFGGARVEFFVSDAAASGYGEGQTYLGYLTADASGNFSGTLTMAVATLAIGTRLTGTATDAAGNTSEFGANFNGLIVDFVVNSNLDEADTSVGDGQCLTASGVCTLRAAIAELNAWSTLATTPVVAFAMPSCPGAGCTIAPTSALPSVSRAMTIDAQTQPGWTLAPIVELLGTGAGATHGLNIGAAGSTVRGFAIGGFGPGGNYAGVYVNASNTTVEGNYIGLAADGSTARPNGASGAASGGVHVASGSASVIGGTTAAQRNVLSGNGGAGLWLDAGAATVIGNYIGTDAAGSVALGNRRGGVQIAAGTHQIGGAAAGQGNVISGNAFAGAGGVVVASAGHTIQGNTIGLDATRTSAVPNGDGSSTYAAGIDLRAGATNVLIGGTLPGEGNVIAGNQGHGVRVMTTASRVLGNSIHGNLWLGIDLGADGVSANDGALAGAAPNGGIDHPVLTAAGYDASTRLLRVAGYVGTGTGQAAFAGARIELFASDGDASGYGEGGDFAGSLIADSNGRFNGSVTVPGGVSFAIGSVLTATATASAGTSAGLSSEFGPNFTTTSMSALVPSRFNAFETSTAASALGGVIKTMTAGQARTLALIAIDASGSGLAPAFSGSVSLDWMDARDASGAADAGGCRASWVASGSAGTANFTSGTPRLDMVLTPAAVGREWRLRLTHTTASGTLVRACSTDAFAVKPADLEVTALGSADSSTAGVGGAARSLTNASASGGVVHRAGRPFALRAQARDAGGALASGYDGSATVAITGCTLPASGCTTGSLQNAGGTPLLAASAGLVASDAMSYSEVGAITVRLTDTSFADVDAADSTLAERTVQSAVVTLGRFVPDHYATSVTTAGVLETRNAGCTAAGAGYTFFGQAFRWSVAPQFTVTALNAQGAVTTNWSGALQKLAPASQVAQSLVLAGVAGASLAQTHGAITLTDLGAGVARLAVQASASFSVSRDPTTPVAGTSPSFGWAAAIVDDSEAAVTGNGSVTGTATQAGVAFDAGAVFHTGRLALLPGHGDARTGVRLLVELQRYTAAGWVTMTEDRGCVAVSPANLTVANAQGVFASAGLCAAPDTQTVTLRGGRAWIALPGTPGAAPGRLTAGLNLGPATSGLACQGAGVTTASTAMNLPHLLGAWGGAATMTAEPRAALTWGRANRDMVLTRER